MLLRCSALLFCLLAFTACSSVTTRVDPGRDVPSYRRYFVKSNLNDNHALDEKIAAALRARGVEAGTGPETMMPPTTQVMVTYYDQWSWDFKGHLTSLTLRLQDAKSQAPIGFSEYVGPASMTSTPTEVIERLVRELLKEPKKKSG